LLAKLIDTQNDKLINNINKIEPVIALNSKEGSTIMSINITDDHKPYLISNEYNLSKVLITPTHFHNNQGNVQTVSPYVGLQIGRKKLLLLEVRIFL